MDIESELKKLKLRGPSDELDQRVLSQREGPDAPSRPGRLQVSMWVAMAAAVLMGCLGFFFGAMTARESSPRLPHLISTTEILYQTASLANPFDFTNHSEDFPAGKLNAKLEIPKGASK